MIWIKNLSLVLMSVAGSLFTGELILRFAYPQNLSGSWHIIDDYGLQMNKSEGDSIHSHEERRATYFFEDFGIRKSFQPAVQPDTRVLVLGDSFTFGYLLNTQDTYVDQLARANQHMSILNAAAGGWGASDYTAYMDTYCERLEPDVVVIIINADDIGRMHRSSLYHFDHESKLVQRTTYSPEQKHLVKKFLNSFFAYETLLERSHFLQLVRSAYVGRLSASLGSGLLRFGHMDTVNIEYSNQYASSLFEYLDQRSTECGSELRLVYTGVQVMESNGIFPTLEFLDFAKKNRLFDRLGIRYIDLTDTVQMEEYRRHIDEYVIPGDGHPNERGARLLFQALQRSGIFRD